PNFSGAEFDSCSIQVTRCAKMVRNKESGDWIESSRARGPNTRHKSGGGLGNPSLEELIYTLELNFLELTLNKKWESRKANHEPDARRTLLREAMNVSQQRFD
ncbi:unnamed protein product, partial [Prorocentrum cordatum]